MFRPDFRCLIGLCVPLSLLSAPACKRTPQPPPAATDAAVTDARRSADATAAARPKPTPPVRPALPAGLPAGKVITLIHSSNLHGEYDPHPLGGLARRATVLAGLRPAGAAAQERGLVQVDAGDSFLPLLVPDVRDPPPDPGEVDRRARLIAAGLGRLGLDGLVPGEADLQLGPARLKALAQSARIPLLAANLVDKRGRPFFAAHRLIEVAGIKVGLFGVLTVKAEVPSLAKAGLVLADAAAAAQGETSLLREKGADVVIGLAHLGGGLAEARALAQGLTGADLLVLGHGGDVLEPPVVLGDPAGSTTVIVSAGERGRYLGRVDFHVVENEQGFATPRLHAPVAPAVPASMTSWLDSEIVRVDHRYVSDPALTALIAPYVKETRRRIDKRLPVGLTARAGTKGELADSMKENWTYATTSACNLCHQVTKQQFDLTSHAFSLATLERKGRHRDPYCLGCHSTAFDQPGGTRNLETANRFFGAAGCETCHGPSVQHVRAQNKTGTVRAVPEKVCLGCHRPEHSPEPFDYQEGLKEVLGRGHGW